MPELLWVLLALIIVGSLGPLVQTIPTPFMIELGFLCLGIGLLVGVPSGCLYHLALYQVLASQDSLPSKWWLRPTDFHAGLAQDQLAKIRPWYLLGALSFTIALVGGLLAMVGLLFTPLM